MLIDINSEVALKSNNFDIKTFIHEVQFLGWKMQA
jgi:hypothetical protein